MKNHAIKVTVICLIGLVQAGITAGCTSNNQTLATSTTPSQATHENIVAPDTVPSITVLPSSTPTATPTVSPTPAAYDNIDVDEFPCLFGLCPSEIEISEALSIFGDDFEIEEEGNRVYVRPIEHGFIFGIVGFNVDDQQVVQITLAHPEYDDLLLTELPVRLGNPSEIRVISDYPRGDLVLSRLYFFWDDVGLIAEYWVHGNGLYETYVHYCVDDDEFVPNAIFLWSHEDIDIPPVIEESRDLQFLYRSLEKAWGITIDEFIQDLRNGNYCFDVPL
jgi:hypothetical protein